LIDREGKLLAGIKPACGRLPVSELLFKLSSYVIYNNATIKEDKRRPRYYIITPYSPLIIMILYYNPL